MPFEPKRLLLALVCMFLGAFVGFNGTMHIAAAGSYLIPPPVQVSAEDSIEVAPIAMRAVPDTTPILIAAPVIPVVEMPPPKPIVRPTNRFAYLAKEDDRLFLRAGYGSTRKTVSGTDNALAILAMNAFFECRGEGRGCMIAVSHVVLNRTQSGDFPSTIKDVVLDPGQFSYVQRQRSIATKLSQYERTDVWAMAVDAAYQVLSGDTKDPTNGSLYYCNPRAASNVAFCNGVLRKKKARIGAHVFR